MDDGTRWTRLFGLADLPLKLWQPEERPFVSLMEALAGRILREEKLRVEREAPASRPMADVLEEERDLTEERLEPARREVEAFRAALVEAFQRRPAEVSYDSTRPDEDRKAGALIAYLARAGYAQVRTDELAEGRFVYHIALDWPRLEQLAAEHGLDLPALLARIAP